MKKKRWIYSILGLSIGVLMLGCWNKAGHSFKQEDLWLSPRPLPEKIAVNAYLKANEARKHQDLKIAVQSYLEVLKLDPENQELMRDTYFLAMIQGTPDLVLPYAQQLKSGTFVDYFKIAQMYSSDNSQEIFKTLNKKTRHPADKMLKPLVRMWLWAKKGEKQKALKELDALKDFPFIRGYHIVLLGHFLKDSELARQGINVIGDNDLLAIGYFPLLLQTISQSGEWEMSILSQKYKELQTKYPATADILVRLGQSELTPEKGLAESLYLISSIAADGTMTREETLVLNSIALTLEPNKQISLVWGGELLEALQLPQIAFSYYNRLQYNSATIQFKKAAALMLAEKSELALPELEELYASNPNNISLLTLLGQAYSEQNRIDDAIQIYTQLIPLLEQNLKNKSLVSIYTIRAGLYGQKEDHQNMVADFKRAQSLDPDNAVLLNDLGYNELELGNLDEGFHLVQKAYQKNPNDPYILDSMAFGYLKKGLASSALPLAEKSLNLMPQSALINAHLGDIYEALGRHREAQFQYKKALDLETDLTPTLKAELLTKLKEN